MLSKENLNFLNEIFNDFVTTQKASDICHFRSRTIPAR